MGVILGPSIIAEAHAERAMNWAQLTFEYKRVAFELHELALGEKPTDGNDIGPIYTRQALAMQRRNIRFVYD